MFDLQFFIIFPHPTIRQTFTTAVEAITTSGPPQLDMSSGKNFHYSVSNIIVAKYSFLVLYLVAVIDLWNRCYIVLTVMCRMMS